MEERRDVMNLRNFRDSLMGTAYVPRPCRIVRLINWLDRYFFGR